MPDYNLPDIGAGVGFGDEEAADVADATFNLDPDTPTPSFDPLTTTIPLGDFDGSDIESFKEAIAERWGAWEEPGSDAAEEAPGAEADADAEAPDETATETPETTTEAPDAEAPAPEPEAPAPAPDEEAVAPAQDAPDLAPIPDQSLDLNDLFYRHFNALPDASQATTILSLVENFASLDADTQSYVSSILEGRAAPQPPPAVAPPPSAPSGATQPAQAPPPAPAFTASATPIPLAPGTSPPAQDPLPTPDWESFTPEAREVLEPLYTRLAATEQTLQAQLAAQQEAEYREALARQEAYYVQSIQAASSDFLSAYPTLSPTDLTLLEHRASRAVSSGQFPLFLQQTNGDARAAYSSLLNTLAWSDESMRQRLVSPASAASHPAPASAPDDPATASPPPETDAERARKAKAAAVSAGGRSKVSPLQDTSSIPNDPERRRQWALEQIASSTGLPLF
jgi:hypothetical protein